MSQTTLKLLDCPNFLFGAPLTVDWGTVSKRDALCLEHLATTDAAFCRFYRERAHCSAGAMPANCAGDGEARLVALARSAHDVMRRCGDDHEACAHWARSGECANNPSFMHSTCAQSCGSCESAVDDILRTFGDDVYHLGDWKWRERQRQSLSGRHGTADAGVEERALAAPPPPLPSPPASPLPLPVHDARLSSTYDDAPSREVDGAAATATAGMARGMSTGAMAGAAGGDPSGGGAPRQEEHRRVWSQEHALADGGDVPLTSGSPPAALSPLRGAMAAAAAAGAWWEKARGRRLGRRALGEPERAGGLPGERPDCADAESAGFCRAWLGKGKCALELSDSMLKCERTCGLCDLSNAKKQARAHAAMRASRHGVHAAAGTADGGGGDDVSGYGHHATPAEMAKWRALRDGDRRLLLGLGAIVLVVLAVGASRLFGSPIWRRPEKLEAKCAV